VTRRQMWLAFAAIGAVIGLLLSQSGSGRPVSSPPTGSGSLAADIPAAHLPILGAARAIEVDNPALNDVGDPYVLPVPAGVDGL